MDAMGVSWRVDCSIHVSIHAPVMDAICGFAFSVIIIPVSIHAPVMDAIMRT